MFDQLGDRVSKLPARPIAALEHAIDRVVPVAVPWFLLVQVRDLRDTLRVAVEESAREQEAVGRELGEGTKAYSPGDGASPS